MSERRKRRILLNEQLVNEFTMAGCDLNIEQFRERPSILIDAESWNTMVRNLHSKHNQEKETICYGISVCLCDFCLGLPYLNSNLETYYGFDHTK